MRENPITQALVHVILLLRAMTCFTTIKTRPIRYLIMHPHNQTSNMPYQRFSNLNQANREATETTILVDNDLQILLIYLILISLNISNRI